MKRDCLLSKAYTGGPMMLRGVQLAYSAEANEIIHELKTAFYCGDPDETQTDFGGFVQGVLIMDLLSKDDFAGVNKLRKMTPEERRSAVNDFLLENVEEIHAIQPLMLDRLKSLMAASVESEAGGKSPQPLPVS